MSRAPRQWIQASVCAACVQAYAGSPRLAASHKPWYGAHYGYFAAQPRLASRCEPRRVGHDMLVGRH